MANLPPRPKSPLPPPPESRERARDRDRTAQPMASRPTREERPPGDRADSRERDSRPFSSRLPPRRDTYIPSPPRRDFDDRDRDRYRERDDYRKERSGYGPPLRRSPPPQRGRRGGYRGGPPRRYPSPGRAGPYRRNSRSRSPRRRSLSPLPYRRRRSLSRSRSPGRRSPGRRRSPVRDRDVRLGGYAIAVNSRNRSPPRRFGSRSRSRTPRRPTSPRRRSPEPDNVRRESPHPLSETTVKEVSVNQSTSTKESEDILMPPNTDQGLSTKRSPSPSTSLPKLSGEGQLQPLIPKEEPVSSPIVTGLSYNEDLRTNTPKLEGSSSMKMEVDAPRQPQPIPPRPRSPPKEPRAHSMADDFSRRPPTGPRERDSRARSPPRGPRLGTHAPPRGAPPASVPSGPSHSAAPRIPAGPRHSKRKPFPVQRDKEGALCITIYGDQITLPELPRNEVRNEVSNLMNSVQVQRPVINKLVPEVFDLMQALRFSIYEADMAAYDVSVAELRRKNAEIDLEKAKAGAFGVDYVHGQFPEEKEKVDPKTQGLI